MICIKLNIIYIPSDVKWRVLCRRAVCIELESWSRCCHRRVIAMRKLIGSAYCKQQQTENSFRKYFVYWSIILDVDITAYTNFRTSSCALHCDMFLRTSCYTVIDHIRVCCLIWERHMQNSGYFLLRSYDVLVPLFWALCQFGIHTYISSHVLHFKSQIPLDKQFLLFLSGVWVGWR